MGTKIRLSSFLSVALFVVCSYATLVLDELKPWDISPSVPHKRDSTIYDLVSSETWLWGPGGEYSCLVVDMPDGFTHNWTRWKQ